jgi:hypothetical protein
MDPWSPSPLAIDELGDAFWTSTMIVLVLFALLSSIFPYYFGLMLFLIVIVIYINVRPDLAFISSLVISGVPTTPFSPVPMHDLS